MVENNIYKWKSSLVGPVNTPYEGGLFTILIIFPSDYPNHGPEFKFNNKVYHLNVNNNINDINFGHIDCNRINEWRIVGKVKGFPFYTVKNALFDIFCLFYNQSVDCAYDYSMEYLYINNPEKFNENAKEWTQKYAIT